MHGHPAWRDPGISDRSEEHLRWLVSPPGDSDSYLRFYATSIKTFGARVVLSFGHEMNGYWYSWANTHTPPAVFVAAWRHIVTIFREVGADNVIWLWTVNVIDAQHGKIPGPAPWWPGSAYVNWVGIDGYYFKPSWRFVSLFGPTIVKGPGVDPRPDPHHRNRRGVWRRPAGTDHRPVRRCPCLRAAGRRVVRRRRGGEDCAHHEPGCCCRVQPGSQRALAGVRHERSMPPVDEAGPRPEQSR